MISPLPKIKNSWTRYCLIICLLLRKRVWSSTKRSVNREFEVLLTFQRSPKTNLPYVYIKIAT